MLKSLKACFFKNLFCKRIKRFLESTLKANPSLLKVKNAYY